MTEIADRYRRRADTFDHLVSAVPPDKWANQSPCDDWDARGVVGHIIDMHGVMLRPLGRTLSAAPSLDEDPLAAFRAARADVEGLLDDPAIAGSECESPAGRMRVEEMIDRTSTPHAPWTVVEAAYARSGYPLAGSPRG